MDDFAFIDALQKTHRKQVGFLKRVAIESKIGAGQVLIAEDPHPSPLPEGEGVRERVGYVMGQDRYFKHDNVGLIHQMNVVPGRQRSFVGATLLKALFDRAAYGCLLYSCWCAQDIEANRFWESMGFVPLACRAGSEKKARVHIFWQKRIRQGDVTTPWWYPSETTGGQMGEARIVMPIPSDKRWSDDLMVILPARAAKLALPQVAPRRKKPVAPISTDLRAMGGLRVPAPAEVVVTEKPKREKRVKVKNDPKLRAMAREFRDRHLEQVNAGEWVLPDGGKYDVTRILPSSAAPKLPSSPTALLPAA
jgi:hypothetical protein